MRYTTFIFNKVKRIFFSMTMTKRKRKRRKNDVKNIKPYYFIEMDIILSQNDQKNVSGRWTMLNQVWERDGQQATEQKRHNNNRAILECLIELVSMLFCDFLLLRSTNNNCTSEWKGKNKINKGKQNETHKWKIKEKHILLLC